MDRNDINTDLKFDAGRKWFQAGAFTYQTSLSGDTFFLDRAQIKLSAQTQFITAAGDLIDGGAPDTFDTNFACSWTDRMDEVVDSEPIWRDMENVYRNFAIARLIVDQNAIAASRVDLRHLVDRHEIRRVQMPDTMPGYAKFLESPSGSGRRICSVCGGVSLGFN